jgi:hypothetical protein
VLLLTTRFYTGRFLATDATLLLWLKGPLAVGERSNVAHGKAERLGALTPENFCTLVLR